MLLAHDPVAEVPILPMAAAAHDRPLTDADLRWLRRSFELARQAARHGDRPFGAVLVDAAGVLMAEDANAEATEQTCTAHAELNLVREASAWFPPGMLRSATLYANAEPCPMCAGAIRCAGVRRVVFGLGGRRLAQLLGDPPDHAGLPCAQVLSAGGRPAEVVGPALEDEAAAGFAAALAAVDLRRGRH